MIYAVIDTNVLVSAFLTSNPLSPTKKIYNLIVQGSIIPLFNEEILAEYEDVLKRDKFDFNHKIVDSIINFIKNNGIPSFRTPFDEPMPDESDRVFYEISLSVEYSFLVTGNLKHYPHKPQVVTPAEMVVIVAMQG